MFRGMAVAGLLLTLTASLGLGAPPRVGVTDLYTGGTFEYPGGKEEPQHFRREFALPEGTIWRAVANVGEAMTLVVNGQEVYTIPEPMRSTNAVTVAADMAPHLRAGDSNVIELHGQPGRFNYFQGKVIMASGEGIELTPDARWQASTQPDAGWAPAAASEQVNTGRLVHRWPGYDGMILFRSPVSGRLFFHAEKDVVMHVHVPGGLATRNPEIAWTLYQFDGAVETEQVAGSATDFEREAESLRFAVNLGRIERGVYSFGAVLRTDGDVLDRRIREPFIVTGRLPQRVVPGDDFEQGMDIELETTIDFTDPDDLHPWADVTGEEQRHPEGVNPMNTEARIVRRNGLVYRETAPKEQSVFSYQFSFDHPGDWYMLELEYPDDAPRWNGIAVSSMARINNQREKSGYLTDSGPAVTTGGKYPLSGEMKTLKWVHRAEPGLHTFDVVSLLPYEPAAAKSVRIYHVSGMLPAVQLAPDGERKWGFWLERARNVGLNFGMNARRGISGNPDMVGRQLQQFHWWWDSAEHFAQYMRFSGHNAFVMGCYQYLDTNTGYSRADRIPGARIPSDVRDVTLGVLEANDLDVFGMIQWGQWRAWRSRLPTDEQVRNGADTILPVLRSGEQAWKGNDLHVQNFLHPDVRTAWFHIVDDLATKFAHSPAFRGFLLFNHPGRWGFGMCWATPVAAPFSLDYSDVTVAAFERDTDIDVPGDGPDRFEERYQFLTGDEMLPRWKEWRCRKVAEIPVETRDYVQERFRDDLQVVQHFSVDNGILARWNTSDRDYLDVIRDYALDPTLHRNQRDIWPARTVHPGRNLWRGGAFENPAVWAHFADPAVTGVYEHESNRMLLYKTDWLERTFRYPPDADWPLGWSKGRFQRQTAGWFRCEPYVHGMLGSDPQIQFWGFADNGFMIGQEQVNRKFAQVFTALPNDRFEPVLDTGLDTNLAIRAVSREDGTWFYVANPGYWPIEGSVVVAGAVRLFDAATGAPVSAASRETGVLYVPVSLRPFELTAFRADSPDARITNWSTEPLAAEQTAHMRDVLERVERYQRDPKALRPLNAEQTAFVHDETQRIREDLASRRHAAAWKRITGRRYATIVNELMATAAEHGAQLADERPEEETPEVQALRVETAPIVDGRPDDLWAEAEPMRELPSVAPKLFPLGPQIAETEFRVAYDDEALYILATAADADIAKLRAIAKGEGKLMAMHDDVLDLFICPDVEQEIVYHLGANSAGVRLDELSERGNRDSGWSPEWQLETSSEGGAMDYGTGRPVCLVGQPAAAAAGRGLAVQSEAEVSRVLRPRDDLVARRLLLLSTGDLRQPEILTAHVTRQRGVRPQRDALFRLRASLVFASRVR